MCPTGAIHAPKTINKNPNHQVISNSCVELSRSCDPAMFFLSPCNRAQTGPILEATSRCIGPR